MSVHKAFDRNPVSVDDAEIATRELAKKRKEYFNPGSGRGWVGGVEIRVRFACHRSPFHNLYLVLIFKVTLCQCDQITRLFFNLWPFSKLKICQLA